jgi:hypothetical protein
MHFLLRLKCMAFLLLVRLTIDHIPVDRKERPLPTNARIGLFYGSWKPPARYAQRLSPCTIGNLSLLLASSSLTSLARLTALRDDSFASTLFSLLRCDHLWLFHFAHLLSRHFLFDFRCPVLQPFYALINFLVPEIKCLFLFISNDVILPHSLRIHGPLMWHTP